MGSIDRRLGIVEDIRKRGKARLVREALERLTDEELEAAEEFLDAEARARAEQPPPTDPVLDEIWDEIKKGETQ